MANSSAFADEARIVAVVDVEVPDEAAGGTDGGPTATASGTILVLSFPRELRAGGSVTGAVADIKEAL
ncbi:hypothetical protein GCM10019059_41120 [Camelimonas fluminis]|nr:hypothetical protein GCM10019059_41120 [Camelimonas fluminis]